MRRCSRLPKMLPSPFIRFPTPHLQTAIQREVMSLSAAAAANASAAATPVLLTFLDSDEIRSALRRCCSTVAYLPASDLLDRLRAEARSAELTHIMPADIDHEFADMDLDMFGNFSWYLNPWQTQLVRGVTYPRQHLSVATTSESWLTTGPGLSVDAEQTIFGCPPFANDGKPTWDEASNRLIYVASNLWRIDTGSALAFGTVTLIWKHSRVVDFIEIGAHRVLVQEVREVVGCKGEVVGCKGVVNIDHDLHPPRSGCGYGSVGDGVQQQQPF